MSDFVRSVVANSLWIVGLAILLAAFSYHYDQAQRHHRRLRQQLAEPSFTLLAWVSVTLVAIGLAGTSSRLWEVVIWLAFTLFSVANAISAWRARSRHTGDLER